MPPRFNSIRMRRRAIIFSYSPAASARLASSQPIEDFAAQSVFDGAVPLFPQGCIFGCRHGFRSQLGGSSEKARGALVLAAFNRDQRQALERGSRTGIDVQQLPRIALDFFEIEYLDAHRDQVGERLFRFRIERENALVAGFGLIEAAQKLERYRFPEQSTAPRSVRPALIEANQRFLEAVQAKQAVAQIDANLITMRVELQHRLERLRGLLPALQPAQAQAQIALRVYVAGLRGDDREITARGFLGLIQFKLQIAAQNVEIRRKIARHRKSIQRCAKLALRAQLERRLNWISSLHHRRAHRGEVGDIGSAPWLKNVKRSAWMTGCCPRSS